MSEPVIPQFLTFAVIGLAATAIQYCILIVGVELFGLSAPLSSGVGFAVSSVANYLLNYRVTFRSSRAHASAAARFAIVAIGGLLLNVACMELFAEHWQVQYVLAQVLATAIALIWTYFGNACWSFTNPADQQSVVKNKELRK